ncbi:hypothetical protein ABBQ38_004329 [Trebouxia sp. C0009 RCD-2024]
MSLSENTTIHMHQDLDHDLLWFDAERAGCLAASLQSLTQMTNFTRCPRQCYACSMAIISGKIPDNHKLHYQLAGHSDEEMQAATDIFKTAYSNNSPASGLVPRQKVCKKVPPFQKLANPAAATVATRYSHLNLNGLPASQSASASPLGFVKNKLIAFSQSSTLNGRQREETDLQYEMLQSIPGLQTAEYLKFGRPAKLKQPPVAVLTFSTERAAAAAYTYRTHSVPLIALHPDQSAGHLSVKKYAEQQISQADRKLAVVRARSPDFAQKDHHQCLQLLVKHATPLYTQFGPNSPEINAYEFAGVTPEPKPWHIEYVHLAGVFTVTFSTMPNRADMAPSKAADAFSLIIHEVPTGNTIGDDVGISLATCIEDSTGCSLAPIGPAGEKAAQLPGRADRWTKAFRIRAASKDDFAKILRLNGQQTFGPTMLKVSTAATSVVGASMHSDPKQLESVQAALRDRCTYWHIKEQAKSANQHAAASQTAPVGMTDVLSKLHALERQNQTLEGAIKKVGTTVNHSGTAVLQAVQEGTTATGEVMTAIRAVADTQTTEAAATQLQLQAVTVLNGSIEHLSGKVNRVATNLTAAMGLASRKSCETIEHEMRMLRKAMRILSPPGASPPSREKRQRTDGTPPQNLELAYESTSQEDPPRGQPMDSEG